MVLDVGFNLALELNEEVIWNPALFLIYLLSHLSNLTLLGVNSLCQLCSLLFLLRELLAKVLGGQLDGLLQGGLRR